MNNMPTIKDIKAALKDPTIEGWNDLRKFGRRIKLTKQISDNQVGYLQRKLSEWFPGFKVSVRIVNWKVCGVRVKRVTAVYFRDLSI